MASPYLLGAIGLAMLVVTGMLVSAQLNQRRWNKRRARVSQNYRVTRLEEAQQTLRKKKQQEGFFSSAALMARLQRAGLDVTPGKYWLISLGSVVVVALGCLIFLHQKPLMSAGIGIILGLGLPHMVVGMKGKGRVKRFIRLFPDAIDLIVRGLRSGLPVAESINVVATEIADPVGGTFRRIAERVRLGVTLEASLQAAARELHSTEFNFFVTSIILQRETGGNLGEILDNLGAVLRARMMMRLKIKAMSSEARASAAIVSILPFGVIAALMFTSPDYLLPLIDEPKGNLAAIGAACSMSFGIFVMSKMAKFEI